MSELRLAHAENNMSECKCKFKEKCWAYQLDGCLIDPFEYKYCYEYMKFIDEK